MPRRPEKREQPPVKQKIELDISSESGHERVRSLLHDIMPEEAVDQLIFLLEKIGAEDYANHCKDATKHFGEMTLTQYGGKESLRDLMPKMTYADVRSYSSLEQFGYRGDYHSVGLIRVPGNKNAPASSIIIDFTYSTVNRQTASPNASLLMRVDGEFNQSTQTLGEHYGGKWVVDLILNPKTGTFASTQRS